MPSSGPFRGPFPIQPELRIDIEKHLAESQVNGVGHFRICFICGHSQWVMTEKMEQKPGSVVVDGWIGERGDFSGISCDTCGRFSHLHPEVYEFVLHTAAFAGYCRQFGGGS